MSYEADLYIMLPCEQINEKIFDFPISLHEYGESFTSEMLKVAQDEFDKFLSSRIERRFLCKITLLCKADQRENKMIKGQQDAFITISQYKDSPFCLLTIAMVNVQINLITYLLDQASREELLIKEGSDEKSLLSWIEKGFKITGKAFFASCMSKLPNAKEAPFILSAEAFYNKDKKYLIVSDTIKECLNKNQNQYLYYDSYMSESGCIHVIDFNKPYVDRLKTECKLIFIMELVILKITAINIANEKIFETYTKKEMSLEIILEILENFAKSLPMWYTKHIKYLLAKEFANRVESSFKVSHYLTDYERNRIQLEQIVNIRKLIDSERKTKAITIFGTILALSQTVPFLYEIIKYLLGGCKITKEHIITSFVTFFMILIALWIIFGRKINKHKKLSCDRQDLTDT